MGVVRIRLLFILGLFSCVAHLALTDIYHAEVDTSFEWTLLQVCGAVLIAFHLAVFGHLVTVRIHFRNG